MANATFEFIIAHGIPMIKIENPEAYMKEGYLSIFRNYNIQISRTDDGDMYLGSSYPRPSDFEDIDRETLIQHLKEAINDNRKTSYDFKIEYEDIPENILEAFIEASIEVSHNWRDVCRGEYKIKVDKYLREKINNLPEISMEELERRCE